MATHDLDEMIQENQRLGLYDDDGYNPLVRLRVGDFVEVCRQPATNFGQLKGFRGVITEIASDGADIDFSTEQRRLKAVIPLNCLRRIR